MAMTTWDNGAVAFVVALLLVFGLQSCTAFAPQSQLQPAVQRNLGRPLKLDKEVEVREKISGPLGIYADCSGAGLMLILAAPVLGCAELRCNGDKQWLTDKPCTCSVFLAFDSATSRRHELKHCEGYGEL